jgi:hypothetical protein
MMECIGSGGGGRSGERNNLGRDIINYHGPREEHPRLSSTQH